MNSLRGDLGRIGQPVDQYLVDEGAHLQVILRRAHHDERIHPLGVAVIGALRRHVAADGGLNRSHHPVGRRPDRVFREQRRGRGIGLRQGDVLLFLVLNVVDPGAGLGQRVLPLDDVQVGCGDFLGVSGVVQRVAADRLRFDAVGVLLLGELILGVLEARPCALSTWAAATSRFSRRGSALSSSSMARAASACDCCCSAVARCTESSIRSSASPLRTCAPSATSTSVIGPATSG